MNNEQTFETLDHDDLCTVAGGNSYVKECRKGAVAGAIGGLAGGPKGFVAGGLLGCLGGMAANAIERNT